MWPGFLDKLSASRHQTSEESEAVCGGLDSVFLCPDTDRAARIAAGGAVDLVQQVRGGGRQGWAGRGGLGQATG